MSAKLIAANALNAMTVIGVIDIILCFIKLHNYWWNIEMIAIEIKTWKTVLRSSKYLMIIGKMNPLPHEISMQ